MVGCGALQKSFTERVEVWSGPGSEILPLLLFRAVSEKVLTGRGVGTDWVGGKREKRRFRASLELELMFCGECIQKEAAGGGGG